MVKTRLELERRGKIEKRSVGEDQEIGPSSWKQVSAARRWKEVEKVVEQKATS